MIGPRYQRSRGPVRVAGAVVALLSLLWIGTAPAAAADTLAQRDGGGGVVASGSGLLCCLFIPLGLVVLLAATRRRRFAVTTVAVPSFGGAPPRQPARPAAADEELQRRVEAALVDLDDAIRSSAEELAHAQQQLDPEAVRPFQETLDHARSRARDAFHLLRTVHAESAAGVLDLTRWRARLEEILDVVADADRALAAREGELERLRSLEATVPWLLEDLRRRAEGVRSRLPTAERELAAIAEDHGPSALGTVRGNVEQARHLLASADGFMSTAHGRVSSGDRSAAVAPFRAAEEAVGQAEILLDAVTRVREELASAPDRIDRAVASLTDDLADVRRLGAGDERTRTAAAEAQAAIEAAREARDQRDPLGALRRLVRAEQELDAALERYRRSGRDRARHLELLDERIAQVGSFVEEVDALVQSRRGAIGPEARTHIAEADRLLRTALERVGDDPAVAVRLLDEAEEHAELALAIAEGEVVAWDGHPHGAAGGQLGTIGVVNPGALVLGGIFGSLLGGAVVGHWGSRGGGWGGVGGGFGRALDPRDGPGR
ncbi:hypothetical protein [Nocardioides sp. SYSU DS0651]|uniref:hypothetical protein n=1 Tax=Nocardioides sp. SYSU DS0651 TaxID=3415955 RepID=UPI003F4BDF80